MKWTTRVNQFCLSFSKKGRISLSKVSVPPLTDSTSSWFIGIAIKNATGDTPFNATKSVTLELNKSFDFSYALPMLLLVLLSILSGVVISSWACNLPCCCCKNEEREQQNDVELSRTREQHNEGTQPRSASKVDPLIPGQTSISARCSCFEAFLHWFKRGLKTYSYTAAIVGFMLMIGAGQFVFANWHLMREEGDRDNCYYNDFCYRVSRWDDVPFNLMISNLVYIIHGLILGASVCYRDWNSKKRLTTTKLSKQEDPVFSIGYAFAWAMIFEGLFSLVYHLCPSKLTFQFDAAFMFVIAGLIVMSLYNGTATNPVEAPNFFLYFLVPLLVLNYFGALRHSESGLPTLLEIFFFVALVFWLAGVFIWAGLNLFKADRGTCNGNSVVIISIGFALGVIFPIVFLICFSSNFPQALFISCIAESVHAIFMKFVAQCARKRPECKCSLVCQVLYVLVMVLLWASAFYLFFGKATTDKAETPEKSRNLNQDCITGFFFLMTVTCGISCRLTLYL